MQKAADAALPPGAAGLYFVRGPALFFDNLSRFAGVSVAEVRSPELVEGEAEGSALFHSRSFAFIRS